MNDALTFGVIGGDARQIALAESLAKEQYAVYACGFDGIFFQNGVKPVDLEEIPGKCDIIILPLPVSADGVHLKTDFRKEKIVLDDDFAKAFAGKKVFGGRTGILYQTSPYWKHAEVFDYGNREEFAVRNAFPTAEGAIGIAVTQYAGTISGSRCLVSGYGRIGKALAWMLRGMGADVTVSARKAADAAWIESFGYRFVPTGRLAEAGRFDLIFNSVPAQVFSREVLAAMRGSGLLIDLASLPGGTDLEAAAEFGIPAVRGLALPGKTAPKTAGEIEKKTICTMLEELKE